MPDPNVAKSITNEHRVADEPEVRQVQTVIIAGREIEASKVVCPECDTLWLDTDFETSREPWVATCPKGHVFGVRPSPKDFLAAEECPVDPDGGHIFERGRCTQCGGLRPFPGEVSD